MRWWAFWRRVQYGSIFLLCCGIIATAIYYVWWYEEATCFDFLENGDERGIDCGGNCARMCASDITLPHVVWVESFKIVEGQYNAVAYVENKNTNVSAPELLYTFSLFDGDGLIIERKGKTILTPGGTTPIFEGRIFTGARVPIRTTLTLDTEQATWLPVHAEGEAFSLVSRTLFSADKLPRLIANVRNTTLHEVQDIEFVTVIFNSAKRPLTASRTVVEYFKGRSEQEITFTWPEPIATTLRSCEVPTDVMLAIDLSGSMNSDGDTPPEPLTSVLASAQAFARRLGVHDQIGLTTFATDATLVERLTYDAPSVAERIRTLVIDPKEETGSTNTGDALRRIHEEITSSRHSDNARKVAILLTDGVTNAPGETPEAYALKEAELLKKQGTTVYTIGLGARLNETFLSSLASSPEHYYRAPDTRDIDTIYTRITEAICEDGPSIIEIIPKPIPRFSDSL